MLTYPNINPIALSIGPLHIHWYGIMYLLGFTLAWLLGMWRAQRPNSSWTSEQITDLIFYAALGVIIGGRLGYMFFYDLPNFLYHPLILFKVWEGGMSFHGGLLGVIISIALYSKKTQNDFFTVTDFIAPLVPLGLAAGRLGNFINGELWGKITSVPWGMVFPTGGPFPRHPSQLYELGLEGFSLFIILWLFSSKPKPRLAVSALFLICYGSFRFFIEFFREPDPQLGYLAFGWMTMGQILSLPMIILGIVFMVWSYKARGSSLQKL